MNKYSQLAREPRLVALIFVVTLLIISASWFLGSQLATFTRTQPSAIGQSTPTAPPLLGTHMLLTSDSALSPQEGLNLRPLDSPVQHTQYIMAAVLDYASHQMAVAQTVIYVNHADKPLTDLLFIIEPNRRQGVFHLESLNWADGQPIDNYTLEGTRLRVPLLAPLPSDASITLSLTYRLTIPAQPSPFGYTKNQTNLADWYPFVPPYQNGKGWLVQQAAEVGEHLAYDIADYHLDIQLVDDNKQNLTIAASGVAKVEENHYRYQHKAARNLTWSVSDRYQRLETTVGPVIIQCYIFPEHIEAGQATLQATADALALYNHLFAPYPHPSLTFIETDFTDGLEYDGLYFLNRDYFEQYDGTPQGFLIPLAAHETAHQWWYALIGNNPATEPWLDESLSVYSELLFYETYHPELNDWWWKYRVLRFQPLGHINHTIYEHNNYRDYVDTTYLRGALFLHELRNEIGNDAFLAFLRDYAAQNTQQMASSEAFFAILAEHSSTDLSGLRERYFSR